MATLRVADIIFSTTPNLDSAILRTATGGSVSHAALYVGSGTVIEALGQGVVVNSLAQALADDSLAVAFRVPRFSEDQAHVVAGFARNQIGRPYGYGDALAAGGARLLQNIASLLFL